MADRPILFSASMVRALLAGQKTQTRRVLRDQDPVDLGAFEHSAHLSRRPVFDKVANAVIGHRLAPVACPYGVPGDRLWVRETWYCDDYRVQRGPYLKPDDLDVADAREDGTLVYAADGLKPYEAEQPVWKPSIHMPRWASRITLEVTNVRVERLQAINRTDAIAEGIARVGNRWRHYFFPTEDGEAWEFPQNSFGSLWESINGAESWDANPWVWVITFKRIDA